MGRTFFPHVPPKTCSINVRLSALAKDENLSKEGMVADCVRVAETFGLTVVNIHIDDGLSGAIRNRKGFVDWLNDAREGRVDHLIAWHVDRMTREGINVAGMILDTIEGKDPETGKQIRHSVRLLDTKGLDSQGDETAFRFRFVIAAEVARAERERMRDRNRAMYERAILAGRWPGRQTPYGFQSIPNPDGPGKVLAHHPDEVRLIHDLAERVLAGGSMLSHVRWANGPEGHPPRRAKLWSRVTIRQVLTGFPVRGLITRLVDNKPVVVVDGEGNPITIPRILEPDTSAALRILLAPKPDKRKAGRNPTRILSGGLLRCGTCNSKLVVCRRTSGELSYRCQAANQTGSCPKAVSVSAPSIEEFIVETFLDKWGESPEYQKRAQVAGLAEIEAADEAVTSALNALSQEATTENLFALRTAQGRKKAALELPRDTRILLVPTGRTIREAWTLGGVDERRELLRANYAHIGVNPGRGGRREFNPKRLDIVAQPPHPIGHLDDQWRPGAVAV